MIPHEVQVLEATVHEAQLVSQAIQLELLLNCPKGQDVVQYVVPRTKTPVEQVKQAVELKQFPQGEIQLLQTG